VCLGELPYRIETSRRSKSLDHCPPDGQWPFRTSACVSMLRQRRTVISELLPTLATLVTQTLLRIYLPNDQVVRRKV